MVQTNTLLLVSNLAVIASVWLLVAHEFSRSSAVMPQIAPEHPGGIAEKLVCPIPEPCPSCPTCQTCPPLEPCVQEKCPACPACPVATTGQESQQLTEELRLLSTHFKTTRKELGRMKCKEEAEKQAREGGVGASGGYCLWQQTEKFKGVGGNDILDLPLAKGFEKFLEGKTIYEFGCGVGRYGAYWMRGEGVSQAYPYSNDWKDAGPKLIKSWKGYDGSEGVEEISDNWVGFMDLSVPTYMPPAQWVLALEVGEHVPKEFEKTLMANLDRHNTEGIIVSWAVRGQGGHHHVNEMNNDEVISIVEKLGPGYKYDREQSVHLKSLATFSWFRNTVMVFRKNGAPAS